MNICFHHVGEPGARKDFPKTVYNTVSIEYITNHIPDTIAQKSKIIDELKSRFPQGEANCWGVPAGARSVIRNLKENDVVLLVEKASVNGGLVPVKCRVLVYHLVELYGLSEALWGNDKFPYIFFFNTERLNLEWIDFVNHIGYKENFRPSGNFYLVKSERFNRYDGESGYVHFLEKKYTLGEGNFSFEEPYENYSVDFKEIREIEENTDSLSKAEREQLIKIRIGQSSFRKKLLSRYKECLLCGIDKIDLLVASHIKPWSQCKNYEKLNVENGLILCPHHDRLFDKFFISFDSEGNIAISKHITLTNQTLLNLKADIKIELSGKQKEYMKWHYAVFKYKNAD